MAVTFFAIAINAQTTPMKPDVTKTMTLKDHVCTASCTGGNHMYVHGENGHTCGDECKKITEEPAMSLKNHECTKVCKNSKHKYLHGEKGHKCTDKCKKASM